MGKYRKPLEIIADTLRVIQGGTKKSWIMRGANLSYTLLLRYLEEVLDNDLVRLDDSKYRLTKKGEDFLKDYEEYNRKRQKIEKEIKELNDEKKRLENMLETSIPENIHNWQDYQEYTRKI